MSVERWSQKNRFELIKTTPAGGNYSNDFTAEFGGDGFVELAHELRNFAVLPAAAFLSVSVPVVLKEPSELGGSYDNVSEFDIALYMSKIIHNDITVAGGRGICRAEEVLRFSG